MRRFSLKQDVDMLHSPLLPSILQFSLPLMLSTMLQLLFNAADMVVVGRFDGANALAAVGSTGSLISLFTNFFISLSVGTSVLVARSFGANDHDAIEKSVHTSIAVSAACGLFVGALGLAFARGILGVMGTPEDIIGLAALYLRIYFLGMPFSMIYNFAAAILRSVGDSTRPTLYLTISGAVNVVLNMVFVIVFKMGVAGVAWSTVISQALACVLTVLTLMRTDRSCKLVLKKIRIDLPIMRELFKIGLPAGLQSTLFSVSNVLIQSSINSFGSAVVAGNSAGGNVESFTYAINSAIYQSAITFTSQNLGAKQKWRVPKITKTCLLLDLGVGCALAALVMLFARPLLGLYTTDPQVIEYGIIRMTYLVIPLAIGALMDAMTGILRGMGLTIVPMVVSLCGICVFRVFWIFVVFANFRSLEVLYLSYPVSWIITFAAHFACYLHTLRSPAWKNELKRPA